MLLLVMCSQAQATDDVCPVERISSNLTKICSAPLFQSKKPFESTTGWLDELDSFLLKSLQSAIVTKDPTDCQDNRCCIYKFLRSSIFSEAIFQYSSIFF